MFELVYLKSEDREELRLLREERDRTSPNDKKYKGIASKIAKIEKSRKSLRDCNMEEATDFRKYLAEKISKLNNTGKLNHAVMMKRQLQQVESHMRTLYYKTGIELEEEKKKKLEEKKKLQDEQSRPGKRKSRKLQNQWTVDLGDLD